MHAQNLERGYEVTCVLYFIKYYLCRLNNFNPDLIVIIKISARVFYYQFNRHISKKKSIWPSLLVADSVKVVQRIPILRLWFDKKAFQVIHSHIHTNAPVASVQLISSTTLLLERERSFNWLPLCWYELNFLSYIVIHCILYTSVSGPVTWSSIH